MGNSEGGRGGLDKDECRQHAEEDGTNEPGSFDSLVNLEVMSGNDGFSSLDVDSNRFILNVALYVCGFSGLCLNVKEKQNPCSLTTLFI